MIIDYAIFTIKDESLQCISIKKYKITKKLLKSQITIAISVCLLPSSKLKTISYIKITYFPLADQLFFIIKKMGSFLNKDSALNIYITLSKRMYYAGETVEGVVHVDCLANRPYNQLYLKLQGRESTYWSESYGEDIVEYGRSKITYYEELLLARIPNGIKAGQYSFPFSLLLPNAFPASFELEKKNYIRYSISAFFPANGQGTTIQTFQRPLHLREPARILQKRFKLQSLEEAKCCVYFCCCCYCGDCTCGSAQLTFEAETSVLVLNQSFRVRGKVDNRGTSHIKCFKIIIKELNRRTSGGGGGIKDTVSNQFVLYQCPNEVHIGTSTPFEVELKVPVEVLGYTAIGSLIYRAYFLQLVAQVNCCYSNPRVSQHVILNSTIQPPIDEQQLEKAPQNWRPNISPPVSFLNLKPYIYFPHAGIDVINQNGMVNQMVINMFSGSAKQLIS